MPGCVLRAEGDHFQPEAFLRASHLSPGNIFRKGEPKSRSRVWETSGITIGKWYHRSKVDPLNEAYHECK
jgi:hypothetical protein